MQCSEARLAANRANARKSSGPRTAAGKEVSRLNAFRHGLAGQGDLIGPGEDATAVATLATEFELDYGVVGESGRILARRAALLSIRMDRLGQRQLEAVRLNMAAARDQFDTDRLDWLDEEMRRFEAGGDEGRIALEVLEATPEGVLHLIDIGEAIFPALTSADLDLVAAATARAEHWLGRKEVATTGPMVERVHAELIRLDALYHSMRELVEVILTDRYRAGLMARFDGTPEAALAHRYEAAAERGMHRALNAIVIQNRQRQRGRNDDDLDDCDTDIDTLAAARQLIARGPGPAPIQEPATPPAPPDSTQRPEPARPTNPEVAGPAPAPVGSFRAEAEARLARLSATLFDDDDLDAEYLDRLKERSELPFSASRR